nr:hypothetical protein CFP56_25887 [Quercus suber]
MTLGNDNWEDDPGQNSRYLHRGNRYPIHLAWYSRSRLEARAKYAPRAAERRWPIATRAERAAQQDKARAKTWAHGYADHPSRMRYGKVTPRAVDLRHEFMMGVVHVSAGCMSASGELRSWGRATRQLNQRLRLAAQCSSRTEFRRSHRSR